jgi:hypothetical protein
VEAPSVNDRRFGEERGREQCPAERAQNFWPSPPQPTGKPEYRPPEERAGGPEEHQAVRAGITTNRRDSEEAEELEQSGCRPDQGRSPRPSPERPRKNIGVSQGLAALARLSQGARSSGWRRDVAIPTPSPTTTIVAIRISRRARPCRCIGLSMSAFCAASGRTEFPRSEPCSGRRLTGFGG